jgi:nucleoside recognition membrane protein YjiH
VFRVGSGWLGLRALGAAFALMTLLQWGPGFLIHGDTGGVMLNDLLPILVTFFFVALLLLPFLVEFGFMEFVGTLLRRSFRWLFRLPGRSAIDASASWMGSGTVGVLITYQQFERGYYSRREAAVIASFLGLGHMFVPFDGTVVVAGLGHLIV